MNNDFLYHHGIKGQKWGVRNGPPYPLGQKKRRRKKPRRHYDKLTGIGDQYTYDWDPNDIGQYSGDVTDFWEATEYTPGYAMSVSQRIRDAEKNNDNNPYPMHGSVSERLGNVNPVYHNPKSKAEEIGSHHNCMKCAATVELLKRGYDVSAGFSSTGAGISRYGKWFEGARPLHHDSLYGAVQELYDYPEGASGIFSGYYGDGMGSGHGGHSLHWRKESGKLIFADGQDGTEFDEYALRSRYHFNPNECFTTRLDNHDINWDGMMADSVIADPNRDTRGWIRKSDKKWFKDY